MNHIRRSNDFSRREFMAAGTAVLLSNLRPIEEPHPSLHIRTPMPAPEWARLQRELLRVHTDACESFHGKYFDFERLTMAPVP